MKKILIGCLIIISSCGGKKYGIVVGKPVQDNNKAFVAAESLDAEPPFGLQKIKKLIDEIKGDRYSGNSLDKKTYHSLLLREQFTYHMIHPEQFIQICSIDFILDGEQNNIFAQLPRISEGFTWGERQWKFFSTNRDSVIKWMSECISNTGKVGLNFKRVIVYLNAKKMIPLIVNTYNGNKDQGLLTVLMLLMKDGKYPPFLATSLFQKLYADENASYKSTTEFNSENEKLIIDLANKYYHAFAN